jgi:hypothetical protein
VIIRERLKFPSGTATALMIKVLHGNAQTGESRKETRESADAARHEEEAERLLAGVNHQVATAPGVRLDSTDDWKAKVRLLVLAFGISAFYVSRSSPLRSAMRCLNSHADKVKRHFSLISSRNFGTCQSSAFLLLISGYGRSILRRHTSVKA